MYAKQIKKGNNTYLDYYYEPITEEENEEKKVYTFPSYEDTDNKLLLFPPSIIHGYDKDELLLSVVVREHGNCKYT